MPFDGQVVKYNTTTPRLNNLRRIRKSLGITVAAAATAMGVTKTSLIFWEKGYAKPQRNNWVRMCEVYRASMTQPKFAFHPDYKNGGAGYPKKAGKIKREVVSDCTEQRIRIVKEYY
jgi:DNA-binding XRE family transcriptional regulator